MSPTLQISVPSTSTATPSSGKPYTQYLVALQLPLRKHELQKRYNDFVDLHSSLLSQTGTAPPAILPPKSWIRKTINNESLKEERRIGLEEYLRAIVEAEDGRWRSCSAWRTFLNLPGANTSSGGANGSANRRLSGSVGRIRDPNQWLDVHRELKGQIQTARQQLKQREAATTAQAQHSLAADAKASLVRSAASISQLEDGLRSIADAGKGDEGWSGSKRLGDGEIRRRKDLVGAAKKEVEGLESVLRTMASRTAQTGSGPQAGAVASAGDKDALWKGTSAGAPKTGGRVLGGPLKETERTREQDNSGVLQLQQQMMQEQDEDVMALGKTVAKLKDMGLLINEELEVQNEMLGLLEEDTTRHQGKLDVAKRRIGKIK